MAPARCGLHGYRSYDDTRRGIAVPGARVGRGADHIAPVEQAPVAIVVNAKAGPDPELSGKTALVMAFGDEYPKRFVAELELILADCPGSVGQLELERVTSSTGALDASVDAGGVTLQWTEPLSATVQVEGRYVAPELCPTPWADAPFSSTVEVTVLAPTAVALDMPTQCDSGPTRLEAGARLPGSGTGHMRPILIDGEGHRFRPVNASATRAATVVVRGDDIRFGLDDPDVGLATLVADGPSGDVVIDTAFGEVGRFELVAAARIERVETWFALLGAAAGSFTLADGSSYGEEGFHRTSNSMAMGIEAAFVEGTPVCTVPRADNFTLTVYTPEVCDPRAERGHGDGEADALELSADVLTSGQCELELRSSFSTDPLSVEIHNADDLIRLDATR